MHSKEAKMKDNRIIKTVVSFMLMFCVGKKYITNTINCIEAGIQL